MGRRDEITDVFTLLQYIKKIEKTNKSFGPSEKNLSIIHSFLH